MKEKEILHPQYKKMQVRWKRCRDAVAGEDEIHEANELYLPKLAEEQDKAYLMRRDMTPWFNASWRTIIGLKGMMFRRNPKYIIPDSMEDIVKNVDNSGLSLTSFLQKLSVEALIVGRSGVLVEYTNVEKSASMADAEKFAPRPYFTFYTAESILNWNYIIVNGQKILTLVRLLIDDDDSNELDDKETLNLILELKEGVYSQRVVKVDLKNKEIELSSVIPLMNGAPIPFIPFQIIGVDSLDYDVEIPPLIDLINMNFHHYRQSSSYERGCFISGLPTMFVYGNSDTDMKIYVGGSTANSLSNPSAKAEFVEVESKFEALVKNLENKEHQMAVIGARMLEQQNKGVESAETLSRKQSGEESILADIAVTIGEGITIPLKWMAMWMGADSADVKVDINKEFLPFAMDSATVTAMMGAYIQGGLSYDTLYYNFDKAGMYPPGWTKENEQGNIDESQNLY